MILQLIVPKPDASTRASIKAFLTGYFDSYINEVTIIYGNSDIDAWLVVIFLKSEELDYYKFSSSFERVEETIKSGVTIMEIKRLSGKISGQFWNQAAREAIINAINEYSEWRKETIEGVAEQIKREIADGKAV